MYDGLSSDRIIFSGNFVSDKKFHLLYDVDSGHYNVITNIRAPMPKMYICNACDTLYKNTQSVTKFAPCEQQCNHVPKIRPSIVVHATDGLSVKNAFRII